jgi:hypothetical protein
MIWAIDLDDGTLINALGSIMGREIKTTYVGGGWSNYSPDLGTAANLEL